MKSEIGKMPRDLSSHHLTADGLVHLEVFVPEVISVVRPKFGMQSKLKFKYIKKN
jgi:hypothetical protein